jgi:hypothetical protein
MKWQQFAFPARRAAELATHTTNSQRLIKTIGTQGCIVVVFYRNVATNQLVTSGLHHLQITPAQL